MNRQINVGCGDIIHLKKISMLPLALTICLARPANYWLQVETAGMAEYLKMSQ